MDILGSYRKGNLMKAPSKPVLGGLMAVSALALVAVDQWTKALAASRLAGRGTVRLLGDFAVLIFTRNRGAFLSLGSGLPPALRIVLLVALPVAVLAFLGWSVLRHLGSGRAPGRRGGADVATVVLIAAGGIGNLVDRIAYGEVRDFLNFGIGRLRTGIMNLADLYILAALILMIAAVAVNKKSGRGTRDGK